MPAKRKLRSTINKDIIHSIQSMVNAEETFKMRNISIRLVDIAKCYKNKEARESLAETFIVKDAQNQFYVDKNSAKETIINNKNYTNKTDKEDSLNSNCESKRTFDFDTKEMEYNDKINISNLHDINVNNNNFVTSSNCAPENILDVSEKTECSDKANTSSISNISNIMDSSLISFLNKESICTSLAESETICESLCNIDQQTHYNTNDELTEKNLNKNHINNKVIDTENEVSSMHINKEKQISMETVLDKENLNMIKDDSPIIHAEDQIKKNALKNNKIRKNVTSNVYHLTDCSNNIKNNVSLSKTYKIDEQSKQIYKAERALCHIQRSDMSEESKKQSCNFQQSDKNCFQQLTDITNQDENLIKMKNVQDKSSSHSISKDMHHEKTVAHFDDYDCNNNSKKIVPKCIITEDIIYNTPYTILKVRPTKIDKKENKQGILKSSARNKYSKVRLSNEKSISFSNLSSYNDGNNDSLKTNVTENISEYKPTDEETRSSSEINNTEITANSNNNTNEISSAPKNNEYSQFKFNVPGNNVMILN